MLATAPSIFVQGLAFSRCHLILIRWIVFEEINAHICNTNHDAFAQRDAIIFKANGLYHVAHAVLQVVRHVADAALGESLLRPGPEPFNGVVLR